MNETNYRANCVTTEAILEAIRPIITRSDEATAKPILIYLTVEHMTTLRTVWGGMIGEISREGIRLGDPVPFGGAYDV